MKRISFHVPAYLNFIKGLGYAKSTVADHERIIKKLSSFLVEKGVADFREIKEHHLFNFFRETEQSNQYARGTLESWVGCIKLFFKHLYINEHLILNPAEDLKFKFKGEYGTRGVFTQEEMSIFLNGIQPEKPHGQRNRAMFELMYSSGLRLGEVVHLNLADVGFKERILMIRAGKGEKDRYVPFSKTALKFLKLYIDDSREAMVKKIRGEDAKAMFLTPVGRIKKDTLQKCFICYLKQSGIPKKNRTLHSIRHSTATHLLEAGADVFYVCELLGHENVETTVRYTHIREEHLKGVYKSAHPRENKFYEEITQEYLKELMKLKD